MAHGRAEDQSLIHGNFLDDLIFPKTKRPGCDQSQGGKKDHCKG